MEGVQRRGCQKRASECGRGLDVVVPLPSDSIQLQFPCFHTPCSLLSFHKPNLPFTLSLFSSRLFPLRGFEHACNQDCVFAIGRSAVLCTLSYMVVSNHDTVSAETPILDLLIIFSVLPFFKKKEPRTPLHPAFWGWGNLSDFEWGGGGLALAQEPYRQLDRWKPTSSTVFKPPVDVNELEKKRGSLLSFPLSLFLG